MKLSRYRLDGCVYVGVVHGDVITPFENETSLTGIVSGAIPLDGLSLRLSDKIQLSKVELLAPIDAVRNVICVGWNYIEHIEEGVGKRDGQEIKELPTVPTLFSKGTRSITGPFSDIPLHETTTEKLDWEAELAVIIGKEGRDIPSANALEYVFGYTAANDVSARDLQRAHGAQWFKGKSLDNTCPLGPWIVTADEIQDPQNINVVCRLNGVQKQNSNTKQHIFPIATLIESVSQGMTLLPGDIILTGTPEGVGFVRSPPEFLKNGDILETIIEGVGILRNKIVASS